MGIQVLVVLVGIVMALAFGVFSAVWFPGMSGTGWLAVSTLPVAVVLLHVTEKIIRRGIWEYSAPYPYASTRTTHRVATQPEAHSVEPDRRVCADQMAA